MAAEGAGTAQKAKNQAACKADGKPSVEKKRKRNVGASAPTEGAPAEQQLQHQPPAAEAPGGAAAEAAAVAAAGGPARKKQRRHKRGGEEQQQPLDPQEALRRQRQRELREVAMKMRAQGKDYVAPKKGAQPRSKDGGAGGKGGKDGGEGRKGRHYLGDKTPGWRPFSSVEVIVLPIFWNNNKEEKAAVLAASERARDILASAGLSADMDASNKYTPGQKMKYWETMGVRVRVELGPRDVANGNCVVALSTKQPGEVAAKSVVNMRHKMLDAVRAALQKAKTSVEERAAAAEEEEKEQGERGQEAGDVEGADGGSADEEQPAEGRKAQQRQREQKGDVAKKKAGGQRQADGDEEEEKEEGSGDEDGGAGGEQEEGSEEEGDAVAAAVAAVKSRQGGVLQRTANPEARKLKQRRGRGEHDQGGTLEAATATAPEAAEPPGGGAAPFSADALEDDFGDIVEFEAEEDKLTLSKKDRMKKAAKQVKAKRKMERRAGMGGGGSEDPDGGAGGAEEPEKAAAGWGGKGQSAPQGKAKKPKVVTF